MKKLIFTLLAVIALVSCGKQGDSLQYMPFQEKEGGKWGLIGTDGKVLFANKFDHQPTVAMHDRFFVQNDSDRWELYSAEQEPKRIGKAEYIHAGVFKEDVAPVVEKGNKIQLIDKDGNVKVTLENIDDVSVDECSNFSDGVAIIRVGGYYGCINTKGKLLIKPEYSLMYPANDSKIVAFNREDEDIDGKGNRTWRNVTILSTSGKIVSTFDFSKYVECGEQFHDGALMVEVKDSATDKHYQGLVDENGNYIIKPSPRTTKIGSYFGKDFTFINDDNKVGVMNQKGDILIGAKYMSASCTSKEGIFHALESPEAKGMVILNEKGDMINKEYYANALDFHGSMAAVAYSVNDWGFINEKGENVKTDAKISFIDDSNVGDVSVQSDYFDEESLDNTFYIHDDSALGISLETIPQDVVGHLNNFLDILMPRREEKYIGKNEIESELFAVGNACVKVRVNYKQPVVKPFMARSPYGGTFMAGYIWDTDVKPFSITLTISGNGLTVDYLPSMAKCVNAFVRKQGKVVSENQNAVITRSDKAVYCVGFNGEDLVFVIARDMPDDFDIDYFKTYFISDDNESYDEEEAEDDQFGDEGPTGLLGSLSKGTTKYVGDMAGFPIEFTIHNDGELHAEYKNVKYGTTMRLTGESLPAQDGGITFYGKDKGTQWTFDLIGDADNITGEASDGNQTLKVTLHRE